MRKRLFVLPVVAVLAGLIVPISLAGSPPAAASSNPCGTMALGSVHYQHVVWIWMENKASDEIIGSANAPYINTVANECGLATNYHNLTHPSLPNYIGATSGLAFSSLIPTFEADCNPSKKCSTKAASIFSQGESWRAYEESMPSVCDAANSGNYAVRHNPPPYFKKLKYCKPKRLPHHGAKVSYDVPYTELASDIAHNALPSFSFITPNLIDDMHNGTVAQGDAWLSSHLPTILNSAQYQAGHVAVFITWDEGEPELPFGENCVVHPTVAGCLVPTIVVSPSTTAGSTSGSFFDHYSLLRTTEDLLHLPRLGQAATAPSMAGAFKL